MHNTIELKKTNTQFAKNARIIGILMLLQLVFGILLNFFFLKPILNMGTQSITVNLSFLVGFSTLLALLLSSFNIAFGLLLPRAITDQVKNSVNLIIIFASVGFALCALEYIKMTEYVSYASSLIQQTSETITSEQEILRKTLASGRNEAHFLSIIISSLSIFLFYVVTLLSKLLPKPLSIFAIFACAMQLIAVGHTLFSQEIPMLMQMPLLFSQIVVPVYLITKGFNAHSIQSSSFGYQAVK